MVPALILLVAALHVATAILVVAAKLHWPMGARLRGPRVRAGAPPRIDADHVVAIDGTTRQLIARHRDAAATGFCFSLGHSTVVLVLALWIAHATQRGAHALPFVRALGSGECHLDANMVRSAIPSLPLDGIDLLVIENVGNLVCPAEFKVGEDHRVMITAVTEGEDKPLKYPLMFGACELVIVNKIDLLPHLDVDLNKLLDNIQAAHPGVACMLVSARTGEGVDIWMNWLLSAVRHADAAV